MNDCLFCKIIAGEIPSDRVYEDEMCVAFRDIHPKAPVHILVVPKKHFASLAEAEDGDAALLGGLLLRVRDIARDLGVSDNGYKTIINTREHGGQIIPHLHIHILGGKPIRFEV